MLLLNARDRLAGCLNGAERSAGQAFVEVRESRSSNDREYRDGDDIDGEESCDGQGALQR
jgi:hypothetical protein